MKRTLKIHLFYSFLSLFVFLSKKSFAQYPGMAAVRAQQSQQFMNQQMQMQMNMNINRNWRKTAGQGSEYIVTLKDSTRKTVTSYMYRDSATHKSYLVFVDKKYKKTDTANRFQKIYPDQTLNITAIVIDEQGADEAKYGLPTDSCWMVKVMSGPINVYAKSGNYLAVVSTPLIGNPKLDFAPTEVLGIQFNDGPIQKLSKENISKMIADNAKATELADKKGLYEAVKRYNHDAEKAAKK